MKTPFILLIFLMSIPFSLTAQTGDSPGADLLEREHHVESMKTRALDAMSRGNFEEALAILDAAIALVPLDPLLRDMKSSILELQMISDDASLQTGTVETDRPEFYNPDEYGDANGTGTGNGDEAVETPDFEEELFSGKQFETPEDYRDSLLMALGVDFGRSRPVYLEGDTFYQHTSDAEQSDTYGLFGDFQYFFESVDRALGINLRYYGNILNPDDGDILLHQLDMGVMLRGFFQETIDNRSTLGLRFGVTLLMLNEYVQTKQQPTLANALTFGVYYSDALLRHIFRKSSFLRKLYLDMGMDYYYLTSTENSYMIRYNGGLSFQISPHVRLGATGRLVSTAQDIQVMTAWKTGLQLTYIY